MTIDLFEVILEIVSRTNLSSKIILFDTIFLFIQKNSLEVIIFSHSEGQKL